MTYACFTNLPLSVSDAQWSFLCVNIFCCCGARFMWAQNAQWSFFVCKYFAVVVQGLCGPRKNTLCEFFCVAVDCLSCTASAWCRQMLSGVFWCVNILLLCVQGLCGPRMLSGVFLCNYFAVVYASLLSLLMLDVTFVCALKVAV